MRLFIDCEFNGSEGGLISMALVSEDGLREFYEVVDCAEAIDPWVKEHVMPFLEKKAIPYLDFQDKLKKYLKQFPAVCVMADYPEDILRLCKAVIEGPGEWMMIQPLSFVIDDALSAKASTIPHQALADAHALRKSWLKNNGFD